MGYNPILLSLILFSQLFQLWPLGNMRELQTLRELSDLHRKKNIGIALRKDFITPKIVRHSIIIHI